MPRLFCFVLMGLSLSLGPALFVPAARVAAATDDNSAIGGSEKSPGQPRQLLPWQTDYLQAMDAAKKRRALLVVLFASRAGDPAASRLESEMMQSQELREKLRKQVLVRVPLDAKIRDGEKETELLGHAAFAGLRRRPGLAVVDLAHQEPERYGHVVGTLPLRRWRPLAARQVASLVDSAATVAPVETKKDTEVKQASYVETVASTAPLQWLTSYSEAYDLARREQKMLFLLFSRSGKCPLRERLELDALSDPEVSDKLDDMILACLPLDAKLGNDSQEPPLLKQAAFAEMLELPGIAMIDLTHKEAKYYGQVVSVFPFLGDRVYTASELRVMLDLPPGTLTQRTLIYAVSTHPEHPASTTGAFDPFLANQTESHSSLQAQIHRQGHHGWESRFHQINAQIGMTSTEVCAESWPGQNLLEAAIECVRCWRTSSGHWRSVSSPSRVFGYDMKCGSNGIWYATGIFGRN